MAPLENSKLRLEHRVNSRGIPYAQYKEKRDSGLQGNSEDETPSLTAERVNKHVGTLENILDSRSFLLKYAPVNACDILATKLKGLSLSRHKLRRSEE